MSSNNKDNLNTVAKEPAMTTMGDFALTCSEFQKVLRYYHRAFYDGWSRCEARNVYRGHT